MYNARMRENLPVENPQNTPSAVSKGTESQISRCIIVVAEDAVIAIAISKTEIHSQQRDVPDHRGGDTDDNE